MNVYDTICLSGGGIKGFAFIGVLENLQIKSIIDINKISYFVGTSIGSMMCYLLVLGYSVSEIREFIMDFNFQLLQSEVDIDNLLNLF